MNWRQDETREGIRFLSLLGSGVNCLCQGPDCFPSRDFAYNEMAYSRIHNYREFELPIVRFHRRSHSIRPGAWHYTGSRPFPPLGCRQVDLSVVHRFWFPEAGC